MCEAPLDGRLETDGFKRWLERRQTVFGDFLDGERERAGESQSRMALSYLLVRRVHPGGGGWFCNLRPVMNRTDGMSGSELPC